MRASLAGVLLALAGCGLGETPERAEILEARVLERAGAIELGQRLVLSPTMLDALENGIPLRLGYRIDGCVSGGVPRGFALELRYRPLARQYELRGADGELRHFGRRSALLAALDRVRLPLPGAADCGGRASVALDLVALPTPLRFPALMRPEEWRLVSPEYAWTSRG